MSSVPGAAPERAGPISLEQLIALNDEIVALVRAGVPLERGLLGVGRDLRGRLGAITSALAERMSRGESFPQALASEGPRFPGIYRAVVEAGLRAGRLPVALEGLAKFARSYAELRRAIGLALMYPLIVMMVAYGLFVAFVTQVAPRMLEAFESFQMPVHRSIALLTALGDTAIYWGPIVPCLVLLIAIWWVWSARAVVLQPGWVRKVVRRLPWMRTILASTEAANFADLLALLLAHGVPFHSGVTMAAEASGDREMIQASREIAQASKRGASLHASTDFPEAFPPLLRWLIMTDQQQGLLVSALRHAAATYRRRALAHAELVRVLLPILLMIMIGASATLLFALTLVVPMTALLRSLALA